MSAWRLVCYFRILRKKKLWNWKSKICSSLQTNSKRMMILMIVRNGLRLWWTLQKVEHPDMWRPNSNSRTSDTILIYERGTAARWCKILLCKCRSVPHFGRVLMTEAGVKLICNFMKIYQTYFKLLLCKCRSVPRFGRVLTTAAGVRLKMLKKKK